LNIKDLRNFWEMIRTEMWEPIRILKQENTIEPPNSDPLKQRLQDLQDKTKQKCENSSLKKKSKK
jgi:hypothetical protein